MSVIDVIMKNDAAGWINKEIGRLPDRAKYRACNSLRSLEWANRIYEAGLPIPACYCALHATEEAVAAFVSAAKEGGYGDDAKINIKDHRAKATVSLMAQKISNFISQFDVALAVNPKTDKLIARYTVEGLTYYADASAELLHFKYADSTVADDFLDKVLSSYGSVGELKEAVLRGTIARNKIFYADSSGMPSGFLDPEVSLEREAGLTLGLLWAALDISDSKGKVIPLYKQALKTTNLVINEISQKE